MKFQNPELKTFRFANIAMLLPSLQQCRDPSNQVRLFHEHALCLLIRPAYRFHRLLENGCVDQSLTGTTFARETKIPQPTKSPTIPGIIPAGGT